MAGQCKRIGQALLLGAAAATQSPEPAAALPADAACVYLAIGCYAPSPLPQPVDPLVLPIPAPPVVVAPLPVIATEPIEPPFAAEPRGHRHRRKPHHRHMMSQ